MPRTTQESECPPSKIKPCHETDSTAHEIASTAPPFAPSTAHACPYLGLNSPPLTPLLCICMPIPGPQTWTGSCPGHKTRTSTPLPPPTFNHPPWPQTPVPCQTRLSSGSRSSASWSAGCRGGTPGTGVPGGEEPWTPGIGGPGGGGGHGRLAQGGGGGGRHGHLAQGGWGGRRHGHWGEWCAPPLYLPTFSSLRTTTGCGLTPPLPAHLLQLEDHWVGVDRGDGRCYLRPDPKRLLPAAPRQVHKQRVRVAVHHARGPLGTRVDQADGGLQGLAACSTGQAGFS